MDQWRLLGAHQTIQQTNLARVLEELVKPWAGAVHVKRAGLRWKSANGGGFVFCGWLRKVVGPTSAPRPNPATSRNVFDQPADAVADETSATENPPAWASGTAGNLCAATLPPKFQPGCLSLAQAWQIDPSW